MTSAAEIERVLLDYIRDELGVPASHCEPEVALFSSGLLDSFAMVSLLAFTEEQFGVPLLDSDAVAEVDTARALARHVHASLGR